MSGASTIDGPALAVFVALFALVTGLGFFAARWRRGGSLNHLDEWGLGGRQFGTWITWFLIGGDAYTAYTIIAVPALVYAVGGFGFFAIPYAVLIYPIMLMLMPRLWAYAQRHGCVTAADVVHLRTGSRTLALAVAATGVLATMPYIALQLVGMQVAIHALGLRGDLPLFVAFAILALYTYSSGLRAPAMIAVVKDAMIYVVVIAAVVVIPARLGGYGAVFAAADAAFQGRGVAAGLTLTPAQMLPYATLALGSALALFMYPHVLTGVFAADSANTIRRNAVLLPMYSVMLGLIALLGLMARAAKLHVASPNDAVPALFRLMFPHWFAGFAYAAIAIGALVPAAVMSIAAANLFTRNVWKAYVDRAVTPAGEAQVAKLASLVVKLGALACIILLPTQFALNLQLLGGLWILQTFPAVIGALFTGRLRAGALLAGWAAGFGSGTWIVFADGLKPVHVLAPGYAVYVGLLALVVNVAVVLAINLVLGVAASRPARA